MPSERIVDVLLDACRCHAPLTCIFAKTGENYSTRTRVYSTRIRANSSRLSPRVFPTGVFCSQGLVHRRKLILIESRPRIPLREKRFRRPILCRESAYRWHACNRLSPRVFPTDVFCSQGFVHRRKLILIESRPRIQLREKRFNKPILCRESAYSWHACVSREPPHASELIPSILQTLNRECTANPWCVLTRKKTFYDKRGLDKHLRGLDQHLIFISQPLPPVSRVSAPLFYYLLPRWTLGTGGKIILTRVRDRAPKLERGIRPLALFTLGRRQEYESDGRHLEAAIRLPPVGFAA
jgi:hypothetical protein